MTVSYVRRKCTGRHPNAVLMCSDTVTVIETGSQLKFELHVHPSYNSELELISSNMYGLLKETVHGQTFRCGNRVTENGADVAAEGTDR
jgi:hypothetical protein